MSSMFGHGRLRLYLLKLLNEEPRHGYDIIRQMEDRFMGVYAPSAGTIYPRLARLEEEQLVSHEVVEGRKVYRLTDDGRAELARRSDELAELEHAIDRSVQELAQEVREDVRSSVKQLREELKTAARETREREGQHRSAATGGQSGPEWVPPGVPGWSEAMQQARDAVRQATDAIHTAGLDDWFDVGAGTRALGKQVVRDAEQLRNEVRTAVKSGLDETALRELHATVDLALHQVRDLGSR